MKREFLQSLMEDMPKEVVDAIMEENGRDIQGAKQSAQEWEEKYHQAVESHKAELAQTKFDAALREAITEAGGRNHKAITALLNVEGIKASEDHSAAMAQALKELKKDSGYLFYREQPPMYAAGTGTSQTTPAEAETLAGALREKFERK